MYEFRLTPAKYVKEHAYSMLQAHWDEVGRLGMGDGLDLDIDWDTYTQAEEIGVAYTVATFYEDEIVGYIQVFIHKHPHHKDDLCAGSSNFFMKKEHRGTHAANEMLRHTEEVAKDKGIKYVTMMSNLEQPVDPWLKGNGYHHSDNLFTKELEI